MKIRQNNHKNGRLSRSGQLEIQNKLRYYFEQGISASTTAQKTDINIKTVCKYFEFWAQEIRESEESDFLERQKNIRTRIIVSFENQILEGHRLLDAINEEIKKINEDGRPVPTPLFSLKLGAMRYISGLVEKKGSFEMKPIMEEALEKKIEEMIKKIEITRPER